eukprot:3879602-Prymnesium_polylepis.1
MQSTSVCRSALLCATRMSCSRSCSSPSSRIASCSGESKAHESGGSPSSSSKLVRLAVGPLNADDFAQPSHRRMPPMTPGPLDGPSPMPAAAGAPDGSPFCPEELMLSARAARAGCSDARPLTRRRGRGGGGAVWPGLAGVSQA